MLARLGGLAAGDCHYTLSPAPRGVVQPFVGNYATGYSLEELGKLALPAKKVRAAGVSSYLLDMHGNAGAGASSVWDYIVPLPLTWGWAAWHAPTAAGYSRDLFFDYDGLVYDTGVADGLNGFNEGLCAVGAQRLVVIAAAPHGANPGTRALTVTVKAKPRLRLAG
jgi:hypothetical protein